MAKNNSILKLFYLDLRALSLFRIGLGLIILLDLFHRAQYLTLHYTDQGILPTHLVQSSLWDTGFFSLHIISGTIEFQILLFIISGIAALGLLFGYKTKLSTVICWILLVSLHNRNPWILNSGDVYLRMLLFWSMFLPLGKTFSLDNKNTKALHNFRYTSIASLCLITQIMLVYVMTGLLKNSSEWLWNGTAIYYALNLDQLVTPLGSYLLNFPDFLKLLTHLVIILEVIFPFFLIIPLYNTKFRSFAIASIASFHIGLFFTMKLGIFVPVCLVALLVLVPTPVVTKGIHFVKQLTPHKIKTFFSPETDIDKEFQYLNVEHWSGKLVNTVLTVLITLVLFWNIASLVSDKDPIPEGIKTFAHVLRIDQQWSMFAPSVFKEDGWFIIKGTLNNGKTVDLFHKGRVLRKKPKEMLDYYISERWRKYFRNLYITNQNKYYEAMANAISDQWMQNSSKNVKEFSYIYMLELTPPRDKKYSLKKEILFKKIFDQ